MKYKILGKTGLSVSELGFGAIQITRIDEKEAINLVRLAVSLGVNLIDTAHAYFNSEEILGKALQGIRPEVNIISKSAKKTRKEFIGDVNTSLKRLKADYIDAYFFHGISSEKELDTIEDSGVIDALIKEKNKGKINHIGFSCHNPAVIDRFFEIKDFSVLMIPLNFISTEYVEKSLYNKFITNKIGVLAMKPFGGSRLTDIELCFKFLRLYPEVIPVAGMQTEDELKQNLYFVQKEDLPDDKDYIKINRISKELGTKFCRQCGYCMPCESKGIEITDVNFIEVYYRQFPHDEFWSLGLDKKVENARECIECGKCSEKCPFNLDVPEIIKKNINFFDNLNKTKK
ncbi:MAG: aldo/keto reductase [Actinobacteria bacterium]|nr:aldo/keto reductase [Actinomycetota bacterium]